MVDDDDEDVRYQVLHTLCDGSPSHLEERVRAAQVAVGQRTHTHLPPAPFAPQVMDAVYELNRDTNKKTRRKAHQVMASYRKTGKWNIM